MPSAEMTGLGANKLTYSSLEVRSLAGSHARVDTLVRAGAREEWYRGGKAWRTNKRVEAAVGASRDWRRVAPRMSSDCPSRRYRLACGQCCWHAVRIGADAIAG